MSLGLKSDGSLWRWGVYEMVLFTGGAQTTNHPVPTRVGTDTDWVAVAAGLGHSLGLKSDGSLWAWGDNRAGQLANGKTGGWVKDPARVGTESDWAGATAGQFCSLAIRSDGSLWAWGKNDKGQLGDGQLTDRGAPSRVGTGTDWAAVGAGPASAHSFGLKSDGSLWAWGGNEGGQLGNGNNAGQFSPVQVLTNVKLPVSSGTAITTTTSTLPVSSASLMFPPSMPTTPPSRPWRPRALSAAIRTEPSAPTN